MIILLGFPKSGTSSFHKLFNDLGYKSYHWKKDEKYIGKMIETNKQTGKLLLTDFLETDVITQMDCCMDENICYWPQIVDYKQLIKENSNAIYILNKRNPNDILLSFKKWGNPSLYDRIFKYNPEFFKEISDEGFIEFVENFYTEIENYFENLNLNFITFDIYDDNLDKLKKYIDIKDFKELPWENKNNH